MAPLARRQLRALRLARPPAARRAACSRAGDEERFLGTHGPDAGGKEPGGSSHSVSFLPPRITIVTRTATITH